MWAAARRKLPKESQLYVENPLPIYGVVNLAGTPDMEWFNLTDKKVCGAAVVESMLGGKPAEVSNHYAQVSALKMLPLGIAQVLIWGRQDDYINIEIAEKYEQLAKQAGDPVRLITIENVGHFEPASPRSPTWPVVRQTIRSLLEGKITRTGD